MKNSVILFVKRHQKAPGRYTPSGAFLVRKRKKAEVTADLLNKLGNPTDGTPAG